jgi:hypothetical protein
VFFLSRRYCDWRSVPGHVAGTPHAYFGGWSQWHAVPTRRSTFTFPQGSDGLFKSQFPERWIGKGGPVTWPPRSPDLTPLDLGPGDSFYLQPLVTTLPELAKRLRHAVSAITLDLRNVWTESEHRQTSAWPLLCRHWTSAKRRSQEPNHTACPNAFSFHACAFYFMSNVTVKRYSFHLDTLDDSDCARKCLRSLQNV